ncbi:MAG: beta-propeller domain-containing protein, partial [Candidatus Paceibacterota bacterium]
GSTVLIGEGRIYAVWNQGGDYISFFTAFLREKCKSLLPNYLMDKAAALPQFDIALSSKELELRALISNWIATLGPDEQARIAGEINGRMKDYLRDHYQDYEKTGIAVADIESFEFTAQNQVSGRISSARMIDDTRGSLRLITGSGRGAAQKMAWLVTGKIEPQDPQAILSNIYIFGDKLSILGSLESLDLPAGICAAEFGADRVYVSTCRSQDNLYAIGLELPLGIESQGKLSFPSFSYAYPLDNGKILDFSKNNRKIRISLIDAALPARAAALSEYDLNDYFVDMDANYAAFSIDAQKKNFFVPAARGGYVFSLENSQIIFKKNVSGVAASRSFFNQGSLYLLGDDGVEVFGGADWAKTKSIKF